MTAVDDHQVDLAVVGTEVEFSAVAEQLRDAIRLRPPVEAGTPTPSDLVSLAVAILGIGQCLWGQIEGVDLCLGSRSREQQGGRAVERADLEDRAGLARA